MSEQQPYAPSRPPSPPTTRALRGAIARDGAVAIDIAYAIAAGGFVAYAVWGTLFPFDFHAVPLEVAAAEFWGQWATDAGSVSLTDLVSNVLLFLPIGLFMSAALERYRGQTRTAGLTTALLTLAAAIALSGAIEFAQAFVSGRTPSILDVAAEVFGAACGVVVWRQLRSECDLLLRAALRIIRSSTRFERVLMACCAAFAIAWWLPADLTLRPAEIADKYLHQRLLLPLTPSPDAATPSELATIAVAAVPIGLAAVLCGAGWQTRRSVASGALIAAAGLTALEVLQIPIFSRTTDGTELLAAVVGAIAGAAAAAFAFRRRVVGVDWRMLRMTAVAILSVGLVLVIEWWPFQLAIDAPRVLLEAMLWSRSPLRWPASASDVLPGAVLAAVAGLLVRRRFDPRFVRVQTMLVVGLGGLVFVVCEVGRVMLIGGHPTLMSVLLKLSALVFGLSMASVAVPERPHQRKAR